MRSLVAVGHRTVRVDSAVYQLFRVRAGGCDGSFLFGALLLGGSADDLALGVLDRFQIDEALEISQSKEFVDSKQGRLDYVIEQGGKNLSGGQRQRLTIARAIVRKPDVLILDDSASALDFATDAALRKAIREMNNSPTVFIVSQRAASLMYADLIIVLDDGQVAGMGTHDELLANCEVYKEIYESQFKKADSEGGVA